MNYSSTFSAFEARYELRFISLFNRGRGYVFPCDAEGHVELDDLSTRSRLNYFYARVVVGNELSAPPSRWFPDPSRRRPAAVGVERLESTGADARSATPRLHRQAQIPWEATP